MSGIRTSTRFGWVTLIGMAIGLAWAPAATAGTEVAPQCLQLSPYAATMRIVRITSDYAPGIQALFVRYRIGTFQMLGTGVRTNSAVAAPQKDIVVSFVERASGDEYRLTALFDPATASGPWTLFSVNGAIGNGTLTKLDCDQPEPQGANDAGSPALSGAGILQP